MNTTIRNIGHRISSGARNRLTSAKHHAQRYFGRIHDGVDRAAIGWYNHRYFPPVAAGVTAVGLNIAGALMPGPEGQMLREAGTYAALTAMATYTP